MVGIAAAALRSDQAHRLLAARGPFASVYFDDSHDAPDAAARLEVVCADLVRELQTRGAGSTLIAVVERAVLDARPTVGHGGRGLIATADGVLIDQRLIVSPPHPLIRLSELPHLSPLIVYGAATRSYVVAAIDHVGADISVQHDDSLHVVTVEGQGFPVHEEAAGIHGWGDWGHRVREAIRKNVRAVADALTEVCDRDDPEVVFVIGQDRVRAELASMLPERVRTRVVRPRVGARPTGVDDVVRHAIDLELRSRREVAAEKVTERFMAEAGRRSGMAVEGLAAVCAALREDAVATLLVGDLGDATVLAADAATMVATEADELSAFGEPVTRTLRADEALPFAALASGADLVPVANGTRLRDGVGALLRYPGR